MGRFRDDVRGCDAVDLLFFNTLEQLSTWGTVVRVWPHPHYGPPCTQLLERIEKQEVDGVTSTHIITETAHRLMTMEAIASFGWPLAGVAARLRRNESEIKKLSNFRRAIEA